MLSGSARARTATHVLTPMQCSSHYALFSSSEDRVNKSFSELEEMGQETLWWNVSWEETPGSVSSSLKCLMSESLNRSGWVIYRNSGLINAHFQPKQIAFSLQQMLVGFCVSDGVFANKEEDFECEALTGQDWLELHVQ